TTCARGCAIEVDVDTRDNTVKRLRPRYNPEVNGSWMCDEGRLNYKFVNTDRIRDGYVTRAGRKIDTTLDVVIGEIGKMLGDAKAAGSTVSILASATCTLEEMFALKKLAAALGAKLEVATHVPDGEADSKLRVADRHPNVTGAELLRIPVVDLRGEGGGNGKAADAGSVIVAVGFDYDVTPAVVKRCAESEKVVSVSARETELSEMAHLIAPGLTFAEKDGLIVNVEGHVQQLAPALDHLWDRMPTWQIISRLTGGLSDGAGFGSIADLRSAMMNEESAFSAVKMNAVGPTGTRTQAHTV
ncbi:MAG: molybdopterin-dependent oxidoreductase, partial [bacterium]|nr:molybdopterin-dependent oxidoreductase [bacterium]